ncbi:MAG: diguanylate cyclase, partial [Duganella sp.]
HGKLVESKDGTLYTANEIITPIRDSKGAITHFAAVQQDISQREAVYERDHFLAMHDPLTGLPNRHLLRERTRGAISIASRTDQQVALMFIDLDGFKTVNDHLGSSRRPITDGSG